MYHKFVDIIIPVYNSLEYVEACINSVLENSNGIINQLIIVNDGSDLITSTRLAELDKKNKIIILINQTFNQGYTKSVNRGLRYSSAAYVILLNSDTIVSKNWLEKMIHCAENNEQIGIVGPLSNAASWQSVPDLFDKQGHFKINKLANNICVNKMANLVQSISMQAYPQVPFVNGFCFLIKRSVIEKIGLMDEINFPIGYGEENDYCIRAGEAGFTLSIADDVYIYHAKSKSFGHSQRSKLSEKGNKALTKKHGKNKVSELIRTMKNVHTLTAIRSSIKKTLENERDKKKSDYNNIKILFILPLPSAGGGSHSVVQEVLAMQTLGITAKIAIEEDSIPEAYQRYQEIKTVTELFIGYNKNNLLSIAKEYDVVIATIFSSVKIVKAIVDVHSHILPAYYVQDYEPMFFEEGSKTWLEARLSYILIKDMLLFAKTYWIARQVALFHGIPVKKVIPSIDHVVYHPALSEKINNSPVSLVAMIRPQTPRRGAERTMRVLAKIKSNFKENVDIHIFGCNDSDLDNESIQNDFNYYNHGIIDRTEVSSCLQRADIFIDLSDYQAFGRTSLEAMACKCIAMLPSQGGGEEYAVNNYNALVVDSLNEKECFFRLKEVIDDPSGLTKMKQAAYETSLNFSSLLAAKSELDVIGEYFDVHRIKYQKPKKPRIYFLPVRRSDGEPAGSAFVRLLLPFVRNSELKKNWEMIVSQENGLPSLSESDIVVIQRDSAGLNINDTINWITRWKATGKKCILELDDDFFNFQGLYERVDRGESNVKKLVVATQKTASMVDAVVVSTPKLYQLASTYNKNIFLIPNYLDVDLWGISSKTLERYNHIHKKQEVIKIGYIGTPTYNADLKIIKIAIERIEADYGSKVKVEVIGAYQNNLNNPIFGQAVKLPEKTTYPEFVEWLKTYIDWDIAVIPLVNDSFNESKSHLKFLECTALGLACICSNVPTYSSVVRHNENGLLVENNTESWYQAIKLLIDDADLRENVLQNAYMSLLVDHNTQANTELYNEMLVAVNEIDSQAEDISILIATTTITTNKKRNKTRYFNRWSNYIESNNRRNRLYNKLINNPYAYFADSKHLLLRPIRIFFKYGR